MIIKDSNEANSGMGTNANPGTTPTNPAATDFAGVWRGDANCTIRTESSSGVTSESETTQGESHFNATGDLLLADQNGQPQAQDQQGLTINYILDGGGTGSRELVLLEKGATTRRYGYVHRENRTQAESGSSTTYRRVVEEVYDFALVSGGLRVKYDHVSEVTNVVSTEVGTVQSTTRYVLGCEGTYSRD